MANFNLPKFTIMGNENRFSVYLLEKDVMEYVNAKNNYNKYDEQYSICEPTEKEENKRKKSFWYKKYLSKMKYLEENYRKTNVYTDYHRQLEAPPQNVVLPLPEIPMAVATPIPSAPVMND